MVDPRRTPPGRSRSESLRAWWYRWNLIHASRSAARHIPAGLADGYRAVRPGGVASSVRPIRRTSNRASARSFSTREVGPPKQRQSSSQSHDSSHVRSTGKMMSAPGERQSSLVLHGSASSGPPERRHISNLRTGTLRAHLGRPHRHYLCRDSPATTAGHRLPRRGD